MEVDNKNILHIFMPFTQNLCIYSPKIIMGNVSVLRYTLGTQKIVPMLISDD